MTKNFIYAMNNNDHDDVLVWPDPVGPFQDNLKACLSALSEGWARQNPWLHFLASERWTSLDDVISNITLLLDKSAPGRKFKVGILLEMSDDHHRTDVSIAFVQWDDAPLPVAVQQSLNLFLPNSDGTAADHRRQAFRQAFGDLGHVDSIEWSPRAPTTHERHERAQSEARTLMKQSLLPRTSTTKPRL